MTPPPARPRFLPALLLWVGVLVGVHVVYWLVAGFGGGLVRYPPLATALALVTGVLPFATFAAGAYMRARPAAIVAPLLVVAALSVVADGWVIPTLRYDPGADPQLEARLVEMGASGPATVGNHLQRRRWILEHPQESYLASISEPRRQPPNWVLFLALAPFATALLALLNGVLGAMVGSGLPENAAIRRIHRVWLLGFAVFFGTLIVFTFVGAAVRGNLAIPGTLAALSINLPAIVAILFARRWDPDSGFDGGTGDPDA